MREAQIREELALFLQERDRLERLHSDQELRKLPNFTNISLVETEPRVIFDQTADRKQLVC